MRTNRYKLLFAAVVATLVAGAACNGGSSSSSAPTPQCTPPPATTQVWLLEVTNAAAYAGRMAAVRQINQNGIFCTTALVPAGGSFELSGSAFGPGDAIHLEVVLNTEAGSSWAWGPGDLHFAFHQNTDGTVSPDSPCALEYDWTVPFDPTTTPESPITWQYGAACSP